MKTRIDPADIKFEIEDAPAGGLYVKARVTVDHNAALPARFRANVDVVAEAQDLLRYLLMEQIYGEVWKLARGAYHSLRYVDRIDFQHPALKALETLQSIGRPAEQGPGISIEEAGRLAEVKEFLEAHAFLNDLIAEAKAKVAEIFGAVDVHLEVCEQTLYLVIPTALAAKDAMRLERYLDASWWLANLPRAQGKFNIIVEYVKEEA